MILRADRQSPAETRIGRPELGLVKSLAAAASLQESGDEIGA